MAQIPNMTASSSRKLVNFDEEPHIRYIESIKKPDMSKLVFEVFAGDDVTDSILSDASRLFNKSYGIWGTFPEGSGPGPKPGSRVKMSKARLESQCLPDREACVYVRATTNDELVANAFACRWKVGEKTVCWITQLVVHEDYRQRKLAGSLLNNIWRADDDIYGIMSSHPGACLAASRSLGDVISAQTLDFIRHNAATIMKHSPVEYIQSAKLRGNLFSPGDTTGAISSVCTNFYVDHAEPLEALDGVREVGDWHLGELLDGNEFLLIMEAKKRPRSRSRSVKSNSS